MTGYALRGVSDSVRRLIERDRFGMRWIDAKRLQHLPRLVKTEAPLLGKRVTTTDGYWHLYCYDEIFREEIYKFDTANPNPFIIDCGANVGLSVIYFKQLYPGARVVAFEPDAEVFAILEQNVRTFELADVTLYQRALWKSETELSFKADGSVGGRLCRDESNGTRVKTTRLKPFLSERVDFLKIDIEGAEHDVLTDCAEYLPNVENLFVEHHGLENAQENLDDLLRILREAGFAYHLKEAWPVKHPFLAAKRPPYSLQLNIFAYRNQKQV